MQMSYFYTYRKKKLKAVRSPKLRNNITSACLLNTEIHVILLYTFLLFIAGIHQSLFVHENSSSWMTVFPSTLINMSRTFNIQDGDPCNSLDSQHFYLPNNFTSNLLKM